MTPHSTASDLTWYKVLLAWLVTTWGAFSLQGFLQITVLALTVALTALQIFITVRDKIIRPRRIQSRRHLQRRPHE